MYFTLKNLVSHLFVLSTSRTEGIDPYLRTHPNSSPGTEYCGKTYFRCDRPNQLTPSFSSLVTPFSGQPTWTESTCTECFLPLTGPFTCPLRVDSINRVQSSRPWLSSVRPVRSLRSVPLAVSVPWFDLPFSVHSTFQNLSTLSIQPSTRGRE
jgi:hypothetical protein